MDLDLRHVIDAQDLVAVEVRLFDLAVLQRDRAVERRAQAEADAPNRACGGVQSRWKMAGDRRRRSYRQTVEFDRSAKHACDPAWGRGYRELRVFQPGRTLARHRKQ
jgi:hypothetical protein